MHDLNDPFIRSHFAKQERKMIKKTGNIIGGVILATLLFIEIISEIVGDVITFLGEYYVIDYTLTSYLLQIIFSAILFVPPFFLIARIEGFRVRDIFVRKRVPFLTGGSAVFAGFLLCLGINVATNYWVLFLESLGMNTESVGLPEPTTAFETVAWIFTLSVMPAIVEEFAFRVVVLGSLRRYSDTFAIFASAALFGLVHGNFIQIPFAFFIGLVFAYITINTGSVIPAMIIHFLNNFNSCVMMLIAKNFSPYAQVLVNCGTILLMGLFGALGFIYIKKKKLLGKKLYKPDCIITSPMAFGAFSSSPFVIALTAFLLLGAVMAL